MSFRSGRHFLQLPGPGNVPDRILQALARPTIDHRGPAFRDLTLGLLDDLARVFGTRGRVFVYPSSATGAWEAAMANTLSPGQSVVVYDQGFFAGKWARAAEGLGLDVHRVPWDWRRGVDPGPLERLLANDGGERIGAVLLVHSETSTGVASALPPFREALDRLGHPALLMVDAVSSLASMDYRHDAWGVDVTVCGSQKGFMMPPGLAFTAAGSRALEASRRARLPRAYWSWQEMEPFNDRGFFPYTPATNLLYGLAEALAMLREEGPERTFARHARLAEATRRAVAAWGLEIYAERPAERSDTVTCVQVPEGVDAEAVRRVALDRMDLSLGTGLGPLKGRVFRIGHLGDLNELMLAGALAGVEMALAGSGCPHRRGGVQAALGHLTDTIEEAGLGTGKSE